MTLKLPVLKILPISNIFLHEEPDPLRTDQLMEKFRDQGIIRNPPLVMVTEHNGSHFMVLDGANRVTAFTKLGYPHILVQVIQHNDPEIVLSSWNHLVWGHPADDFQSSLINACKGSLERFDPLSAIKHHENPNRIFIHFADHKSFSLIPSADPITPYEQIHKVVSCYKGLIPYDRTDLTDINKFQEVHESLSGLIIFPVFNLSSIIEYAENGYRLPSGITRFSINYRSLHLNYPIIELLKSYSITVKQKHLDDWIQERMINGNIRYYPESTVLFDD